MQIPLQVTFHDIAHSDALEERIRQEIERLEKISDRITSCRVVVDAPHNHHKKGKLYRIGIDIVLPKGEVVVAGRQDNNPAHADPYVAVRDAFNAARRQLKTHVQKRR